MDVYRQHARARSVGWSTWHLEWCTKYRYKIFTTAQLHELCLIAVQDAAQRYRIEILDAECDVDHIHIVASLPLTMAPTKAVGILKSLSARVVLHQSPRIRKRYRGKGLWSPGKFIASVGYITLEKAKAYLEAHHAKADVPRGNPRSERSEELRALASSPLGRGGRQDKNCCTLHFKLIRFFS